MMTDPCDSRAETNKGHTEQDEPGGDRNRGLMLDVVQDDGDWTQFGAVERDVQRAAAAVSACPDLDFDNTTVALALSSDARVAELNATYRGKPQPTNVLSFPAPHDAKAGNATTPTSGPVFLGDIILAAETVRTEAHEHGIPLSNHLQHLVVHGLLHLAGFDHIDAGEAAEMENLETRILATLSIPDPYAEPMDASKLSKSIDPPSSNVNTDRKGLAVK